MIVIIYPPRAKPASTPIEIIHRVFHSSRATLSWKAVRGGQMFGQFIQVPVEMTLAEIVSSINAILSQAHETLCHIGEDADVRRPVVVNGVQRIDKAGGRVSFLHFGGATSAIYDCGYVECLAEQEDDHPSWCVCEGCKRKPFVQ